MIKSNFYTTLLKATLLWCCFFVLACENNYDEVQALGKKKVNVETAIEIESYLSQNGFVKAKLNAPLMLRYTQDTPRTIFPNGLHVNFYDSTTALQSELKAKYGQYLENESRVFLKDSVVAFSLKGDTLNCRELYWDQRKELFYTDKNVIIVKPNQKIYGKGLTADQSFKWLTVYTMYGFINIPDSSFLAQ